jgi:spermidine/putrescine transport system ATP-binding protein
MAPNERTATPLRVNLGASASGGATGAGGDLRLAGLTKQFGGFTAVEDLSLAVSQGSFFALLGPSGCGKTTTLRMVAGLERPTAGQIFIGDVDVTERPPYRRPVNTVFQSYALFPHLDVFENVAFGLRRRGVRNIREQVEQMLALVQLEGYNKRRPAQLSGGQQQRVALARAIINRPQVLLLDEPLGALDLKLRRQMQIELKRIQTEVGLTFVHVTHDQEEAMTMADTIAVMNEGRVEQIGSPGELYESPTTTFVANFLGQSNLIRATVTGERGDVLTLDVQGNRVAMPAARSRVRTGEAYVGVRPEKIRITPAATADGDAPPVDRRADGHNALTGVVTDSSFVGVSTQYLVRTAWGQELMVFAQNIGIAARLVAGDPVVLHWDPSHTFALAATGAIHEGAEADEEAVTGSTAHLLDKSPAETAGTAT